MTPVENDVDETKQGLIQAIMEMIEKMEERELLITLNFAKALFK